MPVIRLQKVLSLMIALLLLMQIAVPAGAIEIHISSHSASDLPAEYHVPVYNEVPLYLQNDYPETRYGAGTIATSGCSVVSLAMVATYLTGHEYLPDELAYYFGGRAENNIARLEYGAEKLQLPYEKTWYCYDALNAVKEGKVVIALMEEQSIFTDSQHFIVLTGVTPDGRILVNDSYAPNYNHWKLQDGFDNGFKEDDIIWGFSGAWIFDKNDMPAEPFIYHEERRTMEDSRYKGVELTYEETELLARVVWVESRGEPFEGQQAVAEIVLNRLVSEKFSDTINDVIYGQGQFRSVPFLDDAEPFQAQYDAIEAALYGPNVLPIDVFYFATEKTNSNVWGQIGGHIFCYDFDYEGTLPDSSQFSGKLESSGTVSSNSIDSLLEKTLSENRE